MALSNEELTRDVYRKSISTSELRDLRNRLAQVANQRLRAIEKASSNISGQSYTEYGAYEKAEEYLERFGKRRFTAKDTTTSKNKMSRSELQREVVELQGFLNSKTSTVRGYRAVERQRVRTFQGKGIQFADTKEFYDFLNSGEFAGLRKALSSDKIVEKYDEMRESMSHDKIMKALEDYRENVSRISVKSFNKAMKEAQKLADSKDKAQG